MDNNALGDWIGYAAALFGGVAGMLIGFVIMIAVVAALVWPLYAKWKYDRERRI